MPKPLECGIIVSGSRNYNNYEEFKAKMDEALCRLKTKYPIVILEGGAKGADALAVRYAKEFGHPYIEFKADWDTWGKRAGMMRNVEMLTYAIDYCERRGLIAFPAKDSIGTRGMISIAEKAKVQTRVFEIVG